jgi:S-adenosylmethionine:tRNA ribosyltransferase-isomerase
VSDPLPGSRTSHYSYDLPDHRIARYPSDRREESRLLVVPREGPFGHAHFHDIVGNFREGDVLVVNESRVLPARLLGERASGGRAEVLLVRPAEPLEGAPDPLVWEALVRPGAKLKPGRTVTVSEGLRVHILDSTPEGGRIVRLETALPLDSALSLWGRIPLPPYLDREEEAVDRERYQTVYARVPGSVAAPTAGLHLTLPLLEEIGRRGVTVARVLLHVGIGTFRPLEAEDPAEHPMHRESWEVSEAAAEAVQAARRAGGRVWAVGTTAVRTLESAATPDGTLVPGRGETQLFIRPGYRFRAVDALITNFHLPRSTLMMLVAALAGYDRTMAAYAEAIREEYRFYSYGDAMVILP